MISIRRLLREAARCVLAGPSLGSMGRRLAFAPLRLWLRNPRRALLFVAVRPYTMLPYKRLNQLARLADRCSEESVLGAFVECGVWNGGSGGVLASIADGNRQTWLFDSWQGNPEPGPEDVDFHGERGTKGMAEGDYNTAVGLCQAVCGDAEPFFVRGWFAQTIPRWAKHHGPIALLHIDCNWYESVKVCLEYLLPLVVPGGFVVVDDYGYWKGAKYAVREYFHLRGEFMPTLTWVDHTGAWWRKA